MEIQKQALDKERKRYAEEAVKLRQERQELEVSIHPSFQGRLRINPYQLAGTSSLP